MAISPNCLTSRVYCMLSPMPTVSSEKRTTTITVDLGDLKAPWQAWCQDHGVTPSHALRQVLRQALDRHATPSVPPRLRVSRRRERATARMKLNVTPSELAALRTCARLKGYQPTGWVVAMIRTKLTGEPHVGQPELAALTRSNQQLLALGRNLNQIAKVLNTSPQNRTAFRVEVITELSRVIRAHTDKVSDVLRGTVARWSLQ